MQETPQQISAATISPHHQTCRSQMKPPWPPICPTTGFIFVSSVQLRVSYLSSLSNYMYLTCILCQIKSIILVSFAKLCILLVRPQSLGVNTAFTCSRRCSVPGAEINKVLNDRYHILWFQDKGLNGGWDFQNNVLGRRVQCTPPQVVGSATLWRPHSSLSQSGQLDFTSPGGSGKQVSYLINPFTLEFKWQAKAF